MKDFRVIFNGDKDTLIDLGSAVEGRTCEEQRVLINLATGTETCPLYPERGTDLLEATSSTGVIGTNEAQHIGNFAALDTTMFIDSYDSFERRSEPDSVESIKLTPKEYLQPSRILVYDVELTFNDGTVEVVDTDL